MMRSIYKFFASVLFAGLFWSIMSAINVGAHASRNYSGNNQTASAEANAEITPTPSPTIINPTNTPKPSNQSRPTATPVPIPPPSDPRTTHLMVLFGILIVVIVIFGIWINRHKIF